MIVIGHDDEGEKDDRGHGAEYDTLASFGDHTSFVQWRVID
jgi:hypothetical protein